jgi:hypothetical protein
MQLETEKALADEKVAQEKALAVSQEKEKVLEQEQVLKQEQEQALKTWAKEKA